MRKFTWILMALLLTTVMIIQSGNPNIILNSNQTPVNIIESEDPLNSNLTWTSRTQQTPLTLENDSKIVGDHIILNATFPIHYDISECKMHIWDGFIYATTRPIAPSSILGGFDWLIDLDDCDWIVVRGFEIGDPVNITCDFTNSDCDFYAWDGTIDSSEYTYYNNLLEMAGTDKPEHDSIIWSSDNDTMILACHNYYNSSGGNWTAYIEVGNHVTKSEEGSTISIDTYYLSNMNQTYSLLVTGYTNLNESIEIYCENVEICNFFVPQTIIGISPIGTDGLVFNISWSCEDQNQDDENYFSIWISSNDGVSFLLLAQNYTRTWYVWDSTNWLETTYRVRVRAYSVDLSSPECRVDNPPLSYWPGDYSDILSLPINGGGIGHAIPPTISLSTRELTYEHGSINNTVLVHVILYGFSVPMTDQYRVRDNGSLWKQGIYYLTGDSFFVTINIDGLSLGTHDISIILSYFGYYGHLTVVVTAPVTTPTTTTQDWSSFMQTLTTGISIGSIAIITLVVILSLRLKRNQTIQYVEK